MRRAVPKVFLVAETRLARAGLAAYLAHVGAPDWTTDAATDAEALVEIAGRLCYRSWKPGLNANVSKIREGNAPYLANVVAQRHGSVFEHSSLSFAFADVSRVFTHELVRHRAGVAVSQESLRYVRLTSLKFWVPPDLDAEADTRAVVVSCVERLEEVQRDLARLTGLEGAAAFEAKKRLTSALRRLAPLGLATSILWTANLRTLRHVLALRTERAAEEEIRMVFDEVGRIVKGLYPAAFADFERSEDGEWVPKEAKI